MVVSGDLSTIDLPDLFQNIEVHSRSGTLSLSGDNGSAQVCFRGGHVSALAADGRSPLADRLVAAGHVTARRLDNVRKKVRGSKRGVVDLLVAARAITAEDLQAAAATFLAEDAADLIASAHGEFEFVEGEPDPAGFDADEFGLGLALAAQPLVLEATRRVDHWVEIRKILPSDSMHFRARDGAHPAEGVDDPEFAESVLAALDGSRSIGEVAELFPDRRFSCYYLLAEFVKGRQARPTTADDLLAIAEELEKRSPGRARDLVRRGLDGEPHHEALLRCEARLSERLDDAAGAATAHKLLAHIQLEAGRTEEALQQLEHARRLAPGDPAIVERCLSIAMLQGRRQDALQEGLRLVELYRAPGLHARAKTVLERLLRIEPDSIELDVELARTRVDCGEAPLAIKHLMRRAKALVAAENYVGAHILFESVLDIEPGHREAMLSLEMIDKETYARRRERKRRIVRTGIVAAGMLLVGLVLVVEVAARAAYVEMRSVILREQLIERHQYHEAAALWRQVACEHRVSLTVQFDVLRLIRELDARAVEVGQDVEGK